uniref:8.9 kDa family member n=1 Tax=Rhipicephalus zambeziensis TaxID=60191 RepID=A0A224Y183_9ACAR
MKFLTAFLLLMETGFIACGRRNPYFIGKMEIVNNTCRYRGYGVPNSVCLDLSIPCVSVCCKATNAQLVLTGCPAPKTFSGTVRERDPFWPSCCVNWTTAPATPLLEERSLSTEDGHFHMATYRYRSWN